MTTLNDFLGTYKNQLNGRLRRSKGLAREEWGQLTNDDALRLSGKKERVWGWLQVKFGNHWLIRHKSWLLATAVFVTVSAVAFRLFKLGRTADTTS